ncbi:S8 family serine peptidase [Mesorhizobium sp. M0767]
MVIQKSKKKRYAVLPAAGIFGKAMQSAVFRDGHGKSLVHIAAHQLQTFDGFATANTVVAGAGMAATEIADAISEADFEVISQRFADGPAMVRMTDAAKLALAASNPGFRIVAITRYNLPGFKRAKKGQPAALPSAVTAADANGVVFVADAKQHFLGGANFGNHQNGRDVIVGLIDNGVDNTHPALVDAVALLRCYIPGVNENAGGPVNWGPLNNDRAGHGTHVAGIIAARPGHNGPAGIAPEAHIISYRVFPDDATGVKGAENLPIIDSIRAAIEDQCHIINLSLEGPSLKDDGVRTAIADAWNQGVVCIAAAGNGFGAPVSYPAQLPPCVAVSAIGRDGAFPNFPELQQYVSNQRSTVDPAVFLASFSNFGPRVQFTAPGHGVVSTFPGGEWWFNSGTSMAAPFVAGVLALLLSGNNNVLNMVGNAERSTAMLHMLIARAKRLNLPQVAHEGYGLPA